MHKHFRNKILFIVLLNKVIRTVVLLKFNLLKDEPQVFETRIQYLFLVKTIPPQSRSRHERFRPFEVIFNKHQIFISIYLTNNYTPPL